jgi:Flp pilus assembly protein TadD
MKGNELIGGRSCAAVLRMIALGLGVLTAFAVGATPYRPVDEHTVLERVPERSDLERLAPLRATVAARPGDLTAALALATGYISIGRRNADPRFVAYAQATLAPWLAQPHPAEPVLVLQATALQYLHRFDEALSLLERALALQPLDAQAWLTRAALLELRADYGAARRACARLVRSADEFTALTCLKSVNGRNGQLAASYAALESTDLDPRLPAALRAWRLVVAAEMAERLGEDQAAEADLRAALRATADDPYLKATYADLLLRLGRPQEVVTLLRGCEAQDALLLRLAIAAHRLGSADAEGWAAAYAQRLAAAQRDGDNSHQREQALYLLDVRGDAQRALQAAASNWAVQREPTDVRIYARAAVQARSQPDRAAIAGWLAANHYEDRTLPGLSTDSAGHPL